MANIPRVYTVGQIFQGPVDVYIKITAPASSASPTADAQCLTLDANGQPSSATGSHLGSVEGPTHVTITEKCNEIMDDQHESPIDVAFDTTEAEIDINMKETSLTRLQQVMTDDNLNAYNSLANSQALQFGGQFSSAMNAMTLLLVSPDRATAGKWLYILAYKTYLKSAIAAGFSRSKEIVYKLKFGAFMDLSRVSGDELMQIVRTK